MRRWSVRLCVSCCAVGAGAAAAQLRAGEQHEGQPAVQHAVHWQPEREHQRGRAARPLRGAAGLPPAQACSRRTVGDVLCRVLGRRVRHGRAPEPAGAAGDFLQGWVGSSVGNKQLVFQDIFSGGARGLMEEKPADFCHFLSFTTQMTEVPL